MKWISLTSEDQFNDILKNSTHNPQVIFKHSTRCSVSAIAKNRLEQESAPPGIEFHYLNVIAYRQLSLEIAKRLGVHHESPQVLVIRNGECVYDESHLAINMEDIASYSIAA